MTSTTIVTGNALLERERSLSGTRTGLVGVERQDRSRREPRQLLDVLLSPSAVPHVATTLSIPACASPITSVYPSTTNTSPVFATAWRARCML